MSNSWPTGLSVECTLFPGGFSFASYHHWGKHCVEMPDVGLAFCWVHSVVPKSRNSLLFGLTAFRKKCLSHAIYRSSIGFRSGDSGGVFHQLMSFSSIKVVACLLILLLFYFISFAEKNKQTHKQKERWQGHRMRNSCGQLQRVRMFRSTGERCPS